MTNQKTYKLEKVVYYIQVPGVTLFEGYARLPTFYLSLLGGVYG